MRKILLAIAAVALVAPASAGAYTDQGTAQVQILNYWPVVAGRELNGPGNTNPALIYSAGVDPNAMWRDHGNWGGHLRIYYSPWWDRGRTFLAEGVWDCIAFSPITTYCERRK